MFFSIRHPENVEMNVEPFHHNTITVLRLSTLVSGGDWGHDTDRRLALWKLWRMHQDAPPWAAELNVRSHHFPIKQVLDGYQCLYLVFQPPCSVSNFCSWLPILSSNMSSRSLLRSLCNFRKLVSHKYNQLLFSMFLKPSLRKNQENCGGDSCI